MKRLIRNRGVPLLVVILIVALCSALAAGWASERQSRIDQVEQLERLIRENRALHQAQTYAMDYALRSEQAKAGTYESHWHQALAKLRRCRITE